MANIMSDEKRAIIHARVLNAAALLFLEEGYTKTTLKKISEKSGIQISSINREYGGKVNILCELIHYAFGGQIDTTNEIFGKYEDDRVLYYAVETALQLHISDASASIRNLYITAYTTPETIQIIRREVLEILIKKTFRPYLTDGEYENIHLTGMASMGIILAYMLMPVDGEVSTMDKVRQFLKASLRNYKVPEEKIESTIEYIEKLDFKALAEKTIDGMIAGLKQQADVLEGVSNEQKRM